MVRSLLIRGMLAGALAGLLASGFAWLVGEPQVDHAIAFEQQLRAVAGEAPELVLVSRAVQSTAGLVIGIFVYGSALGGIFSLVFAYANGRVGRLSPRATAAMLAAIGFAALILIPQLKYPANPPAVGEPATIGMRTALYFIMIALSAIAAAAATSTARQIMHRVGAWNSALIGGAAYLAVMITAMRILPRVNEVPAYFPATVLWDFRLASLGIEAVLWTSLALVFGALAERRLIPTANGSAVGP